MPAIGDEMRPTRPAWKIGLANLGVRTGIRADSPGSVKEGEDKLE